MSKNIIIFRLEKKLSICNYNLVELIIITKLFIKYRIKSHIYSIYKIYGQSKI